MAMAQALRQAAPPYAALTIAKWFIAWAEAEGEELSWDEVDPHTAELLSEVWNTYGGFSAGHLRNMTHEEPPWQRHWQDGVRGISIPQQEIEEYFASRR